MSDKIKQDNVTAQGSVVGHDQYNTTYAFSGPVSPMTKLSIAFMEEAKKDDEYNSVLPELEHYMSNIDAGEVIGLEEKLKIAKKDGDIPEAKRQKEIVAKRLHRHATSRASQNIYVFILGMLLNRFRTYVKPMIDEGQSNNAINKAILINVLEPTLNVLEENVLEIYWDDIWGMIYYLTGNCHIKWAK